MLVCCISGSNVLCCLVVWFVSWVVCGFDGRMSLLCIVWWVLVNLSFKDVIVNKFVFVFVFFVMVFVVCLIVFGLIFSVFEL